MKLYFNRKGEIKETRGVVTATPNYDKAFNIMMGAIKSQQKISYALIKK